MLPVADQYVNIHAHRDSGGPGEWVLRSVRIGDYHPGCCGTTALSVGIHPWDTGDIRLDEAFAALKKVVEEKQVIAIGEAGIDRFRGALPDVQMRWFEAQAGLAAEHGMPVIIHVVKAFQELVRYALTRSHRVPLIIHGFRGSAQLASDLAGHGFYLSFGPALLQSEKVQEALRAVPSGQFFLETDDSDVPVEQMYRVAATLLNMDPGMLKNQIAERTAGLFSR